MEREKETSLHKKETTKASREKEVVICVVEKDKFVKAMKTLEARATKANQFRKSEAQHHYLEAIHHKRAMCCLMNPKLEATMILGSKVEWDNWQVVDASME